ncbi:hypothetical protein [Nostoc sp.]
MLTTVIAPHPDAFYGVHTSLKIPPNNWFCRSSSQIMARSGVSSPQYLGI